MNIILSMTFALIFLAGIMLALPFFVDLARYQDHYKPLIEAALNRKIQLQSMRLTLWPRFGARVDGFTILDDPSFGTTPFASLSSLDVGVKLMPLLSGKIDIEEIALHDPVITVVTREDGVLNLSTLGPASAAPAELLPPEAPRTHDPLRVLGLFAVDRVAVSGGQLLYRDHVTNPPAEHRVKDLELLMKYVRLGQTPTIQLTGSIQPRNLSVTLSGSFGPLVETLDVNRFDFTTSIGKLGLALTGALTDKTLHLTVSSKSIDTADLPIRLPLTRPVEIRNFLAVAKAPYPLKQDASPLKMADLSDLRMDVVMGHSTAQVAGTVLDGLAKVTVTSPAVSTDDLPIETGLPKPVSLTNLEVTAEATDQKARLLRLAFDVFEGRALVQGTLATSEAIPPFKGTIEIHGIHLGRVLETMRPSSAIAVGGTAHMDLAVSGRGLSMSDLNHSLEGTGHVGVAKGRLEGINLTQEVAGLFHIGGLSVENVKYTAFSAIESDFLIKHGIARARNLRMDSQDFQAAGGGTIGFDAALNLALNVQLSRTLSQRIASGSTFTKLAMKEGRLMFPLTVTGTVQDPSLGLDLKTLTGTVQTQVEEKVKDAVRGLLEGTTKPQDLPLQGKEILKELFGR